MSEPVDEEKAKLRAELADLREKLSNNRTTCAYCEAVQELPCTFADIRAHIEVCPKHPLAAARREASQLRDALEVLKAAAPLTPHGVDLKALVVEAANALAGPTSRCFCRNCAENGPGFGPCLVKLAKKLKEAVR